MKSSKLYRAVLQAIEQSKKNTCLDAQTIMIIGDVDRKKYH